MQETTADTAAPLWVICLCAEWCKVCRDWRATFEEAARSHPQTRFAWVDVEDEDDAMGDVDIETFPTVLIARGPEALFLGPIQPSGAQLNRLVASLMQEAPNEARGAMPVSGQASPLLARLQAGVLPKA